MMLNFLTGKGLTWLNLTMKISILKLVPNKKWNFKAKKNHSNRAKWENLQKKWEIQEIIKFTNKSNKIKMEHKK